MGFCETMKRRIRHEDVRDRNGVGKKSSAGKRPASGIRRSGIDAVMIRQGSGRNPERGNHPCRRRRKEASRLAPTSRTWKRAGERSHGVRGRSKENATVLSPRSLYVSVLAHFGPRREAQLRNRKESARRTGPG